MSNETSSSNPSIANDDATEEEELRAAERAASDDTKREGYATKSRTVRGCGLFRAVTSRKTGGARTNAAIARTAVRAGGMAGSQSCAKKRDKDD